jgi:cell division protein ZapA
MIFKKKQFFVAKSLNVLYNDLWLLNGLRSEKMKEKVEVIIAGKKYTVVGSEASDYMERVADYVNEKMQMLLDNNSQLTMEGAAVLTAINVADDYFKAEETADNLREQVGAFLKSGKGGKGGASDKETE